MDKTAGGPGSIMSCWTTGNHKSQNEIKKELLDFTAINGDFLGLEILSVCVTSRATIEEHIPSAAFAVDLVAQSASIVAHLCAGMQAGESL